MKELEIYMIMGRKKRKCKVCGKELLMWPHQYTCDECLDKICAGDKDTIELSMKDNMKYQMLKAEQRSLERKLELLECIESSAYNVLKILRIKHDTSIVSDAIRQTLESPEEM